MWMWRPHRNVATVRAFTLAGIDDEDTAVAKQRNNGPALSALRGRGALGVQVGEWRPRADGMNIERNAPSVEDRFSWS